MSKYERILVFKTTIILSLWFIIHVNVKYMTIMS